MFGRTPRSSIHQVVRSAPSPAAFFSLCDFPSGTGSRPGRLKKTIILKFLENCSYDFGKLHVSGKGTGRGFFRRRPLLAQFRSATSGASVRKGQKQRKNRSSEGVGGTRSSRRDEKISRPVRFRSCRFGRDRTVPVACVTVYAMAFRGKVRKNPQNASEERAARDRLLEVGAHLPHVTSPIPLASARPFASGGRHAVAIRIFRDF